MLYRIVKVKSAYYRIQICQDTRWQFHDDFYLSKEECQMWIDKWIKENTTDELDDIIIEKFDKQGIHGSEYEFQCQCLCHDEDV